MFIIQMLEICAWIWGKQLAFLVQKEDPRKVLPDVEHPQRVGDYCSQCCLSIMLKCGKPSNFGFPSCRKLINFLSFLCFSSHVCVRGQGHRVCCLALLSHVCRHLCNWVWGRVLLGVELVEWVTRQVKILPSSVTTWQPDSPPCRQGDFVSL